MNKKVGNNLQSIDYTYNIRGWMTKINDPANLNGKLFGYKVKYSEVEGLETPNTDFSTLKVKPKYNGNIAEVDWRTGTTTGDNLRRYGYVYDGVNRLLAGFYQKDTNPSAKEYFEKMEYDLNGNISNLKRSAQSQQGASAFNIDDLGYIYTGNRLTSVTDSSTDYRGYPDTSGNPIRYDSNGNMISHRDKGILQIDYNFLNLPKYIKFDNFITTRAGKIYVNTAYTYRADGVKVGKQYSYKNSSNITHLFNERTDYLDGFQYTNELLKFVPTSEGYYNFENNKYIYNYTDHLGNIRLSYFNNGSGAEVLEENNYYPFGMKHEAYNVLPGNPAYKYSYNGKELQTESGLYDYGARFYMADIGRWGVVDPLAEKTMDIYGYVWNNPIKFIDPDGQSGEPTLDKKNKTITINQHLIFYGGKATSKLSDKIATGISSQWNGANGRVKVGGVEYKVKFKVTYETVSEVDAKKMASGNTDIKNNFIRVEDGKNGESSFTQELGANSYYFNTDDDLAGSTTPAHEIGHGLGLDHTNKGGQNENDVPDIMEARGTQVHPKWSKKGPSNSIDPNFRRVDKTEVYDVLKGVRFDKNGKGKIGKTTNKIYDKNFIIILLFFSCKFNENNVASKENVIVIKNDSLKNLSSEWKKDNIGCLKYRNVKNFNKLLSGYKLLNKKSKKEFINVLGIPNQELVYDNFSVIIYYYNSICVNNKLLIDSDKSNIRIKFDKKNEYLNFDTRIE
ncbi:RHS repeat-associated core domain-containing protein [Chryseobacterium sp.]|uniref:RHS repeat-associated core domain-containing protein n=1 Tax=Chryseobacterium sp. TaxID=1871047 RepID=UPI0035C73F54